MATATTTITSTIRQQLIVLQLRLPPTHRVEEPQEPPRTVTWDSGVVDNEKMNKRKSKKCCVFHKQRPFDESDSEDDSEDDDGGWELGENGVPVWIPNDHHHEHNDSCRHD